MPPDDAGRAQRQGKVGQRADHRRSTGRVALRRRADQEADGVGSAISPCRRARRATQPILAMNVAGVDESWTSGSAAPV